MTRRFQFSLRALLVVVTAFTIFLGWLVESARRQRTAIESLADIPHRCFYRGEATVDQSGILSEVGPVSGIRKWIADWVGIDYVADVTVLGLSLRKGVPDFESLAPLQLEYLSLERVPAQAGFRAGGGSPLRLDNLSVEGSQFDRRALGSLKRMKTLRWLVLYGDVGLSDQDVSDLRQALPACRVTVLPQPWSRT
jgi:hypothetical protein